MRPEPCSRERRIYKVERQLGAGGMGVVYAVRHTFLNRLEALKTIHPELVYRKDIAQRMRKEAEVLGGLRHPNIVQATSGGMIEDEWRLSVLRDGDAAREDVARF